MSDRVFQISLTTLTALVLVWIIGGILLGALGMPWAWVDMPSLVFLTVLIGLVVLIIGFGLLLHFWGKHYMSRG